MKRFKYAHRLNVDRSDVGVAFTTTFDFEEIADGYGDLDVDPFRGVYGPQMMYLVEQWETRERFRKQVAIFETQLALDLFDSLTDDGRSVAIEQLVANRRARRQADL